ncbi:MAG: hypothetical protein NVSMB32_13070 [Actinomycetota bacterium]
MSADEEKTDATDKLPKDGAEALSALRNLWGATGRERAFFGAGGTPGSPDGAALGKSAMEQIVGEIGFGGLETFAEDGEATTNTHQAGQRLSAAWKKTMEREGKLTHPGKSVSDLIAAQREGMPKGTPGEAKPKRRPLVEEGFLANDPTNEPAEQE